MKKCIATCKWYHIELERSHIKRIIVMWGGAVICLGGKKVMINECFHGKFISGRVTFEETVECIGGFAFHI